MLLRADRLPIVFAVSALLMVSAARAEVTGITFTRSSPFGDTSFGSAGAYETPDGPVTGEDNPREAKNRIIRDIDKAPHNARGNVEYGMTFSPLKPVDL